MEEKIYLHNICFQIFLHISLNNIFKNHYMLIVKYIYEQLRYKTKLWLRFEGACSSVEMLKCYILICWNAEGVHAHLPICWRGTWSFVGMLKGCMVICRNAEGVYAHLSECWRGTWSSVGMLKVYMLIFWNAEGVHAHLSECWRFTCLSFGMLKGYMVNCRNAECVHTHLLECRRGICSSVGMQKGYMLICRNAQAVHGHLSECRRGTCSYVGMLKGYMGNKSSGTPDLRHRCGSRQNIGCSKDFSWNFPTLDLNKNYRKMTSNENICISFLGATFFKSKHIKRFYEGYHTFLPRCPWILPCFEGKHPN